MRTRAFTFASAEGLFSIRIPRGWRFIEGDRLRSRNRQIISNSPPLRRELLNIPSPLEHATIQPSGEIRTYISAGRVFTRGRRARGVMFTEISIFRTMHPTDINHSAQELNNTLLAKLRERMPNSQHVRVIRTEVKMLNGYVWAKTTISHHGITYVFWQAIIGDSHYIVEFQTDNLPLAEPVFENIMRSFSFRH